MRRGRLLQGGQRPVIIAAAIAEPGAAAIEAEQRHQDDVGLDLRSAFLGRQRAETGLVERRALLPEPKFQRLFVAEHHRQADGLARIHQPADQRLEVEFVADRPVAGDDLTACERHGTRGSAAWLAATPRRAGDDGMPRAACGPRRAARPWSSSIRGRHRAFQPERTWPPLGQAGPDPDPPAE